MSEVFNINVVYRVEDRDWRPLPILGVYGSERVAIIKHPLCFRFDELQTYRGKPPVMFYNQYMPLDPDHPSRFYTGEPRYDKPGMFTVYNLMPYYPSNEELYDWFQCFDLFSKDLGIDWLPEFQLSRYTK